LADRTTVTVDGNEAVASIAYRMNEVIALYPITPSSTMGELCDEWAARRAKNLWDQVPQVVEMQSEGGAAGAVHGALQTGALATTFTASQGLLLMIPNLYKIAGELNGFCLHVAARTVATHALSIFGDHSDVMACRATGVALLASGSVQEAQDLACIAQIAALEGRVPFLHFFDGFRTSHELNRIAPLSDDDLRFMLDDELIAAHRRRALSPDHPVVRGTAQNPDTFFQAREACNPFYDAVPRILREVMERFERRTGRRYRPYEYFGAADAERVVVLMGSGAQAARETVDALNARGEKVGVVVVRMFRPFDVGGLVETMPRSVKAIAVLDRTKEPGSAGEPLYQDVVVALREVEGAAHPASPARVTRVTRVIGGRYGLSSKEFTPAMVKAVLDELEKPEPRNHFTVGIVDDVTRRSLEVDEGFDLEPDDVVRCVFHGLGSDGTVSANKSTIKILGERTGLEVQGYFVYDSKKAGARTVSHLRFSPRPIRSTYLIRKAAFVACHQPQFLDRVDVLSAAQPGATFLLNSPHAPGEVFDRLPREVQDELIAKRLRFFVVDADKVARESGLDGRINTVMQVCFFALTKLLPTDEALAAIEEGIRKTYGKKGDEIVKRNVTAARAALAHLGEVKLPAAATAKRWRPPPVPRDVPDFVARVTAAMLSDHGDALPVSAFPPDGTWPVGTARYEKRAIADFIPIWDEKLCIQCNKCAFVCPHAAIRVNAYPATSLAGAPEGFRAVDYKGRELPGLKYTVQVAPEDCTGCRLCAVVCPAKDKSDPRHKSLDMLPMAEHVEAERASFAFFEKLPPLERAQVGAERIDVKSSQFHPPLFEFSGACAGCGETPYVRLLTQLFGDRLLIANATGCSSIYGGNLPTTPYCAGADGRGPAWSNSLFEDNAEFGLGFRLALDARRELARALVSKLAPRIGIELAGRLLEVDGDSGEAGIAARRGQVAELRRQLSAERDPDARRLLEVADDLVQKSVWLVGGDGWAYDIGFGGLDHVLSSGRKVNVLVLDTEVYSNTGGQQSKATPLGASAKFAIAGKESHKKDLGLIAMSYGNVYVASIAFGAKDAQTVQALTEAESYPGPSIVIAYSHCIAHGYDLAHGLDQQKKAVGSGVWPLYRYDPRRVAEGLPPLHLDSGAPTVKVRDYMAAEARFRMVERADPVRFERLAVAAQQETDRRLKVYDHLAHLELAQRAQPAAPNGPVQPMTPVAPIAPVAPVKPAPSPAKN
jgi:pyruvate-ferredoxin/flavodoxin oxidoreductase